jgi:class 3 adenylate cyclase
MDQLRPKPSEEVRAVFRRFFDALADGDAEALRNLVSSDPCMVAIGTDPNEWWVGANEALRIWQAQQLESGGWKLGTSEIDAWELGLLGWASCRAQIFVRRGQADPYDVRATGVFLLDSGQWRLIQWHHSTGVTNEDLYHLSLTTSPAALAESIEADRPDLTDVASTDGTVTLVFTDIEASSEINERLGDRRWIELLHWQDEIVRSEVARHAGSVVKWQGDGYMLAFSSAANALACARSIQAGVASGFDSQPVRVRIGINSGEAIKDRDDFFGHAVAVASRVAAQALGGEVLVTDLVAGLVAGDNRFTFGTSREVELKGFEGTFSLRPLESNRQH